MNPPNKKLRGARSVPQPLSQRTTRASQFKPVVAQAKNAPAATKVRQALPAIYTPQAKPNAVQRKAVGLRQVNRPPVAPPVYRPQPVSRCLQPKMATQKPLDTRKAHHVPVAPPVYRPQPGLKILQAKPAVRKNLIIPHASSTADRHNAAIRLPPFPHKRVPSSIQRHMNWATNNIGIQPSRGVLQRAAAGGGDAELRYLENLQAYLNAQREESGADAPKLNPPESKEDKEDIPVKRDVYDKEGRATLAALAQQCNKTVSVDGRPYQVIDLAQRNEHSEHTNIFKNLYAQIGKAAVNYKNGPLHRNEEAKLPVSDPDWRYIECYYAGGGLRLVVDTKKWLSFVSSHYSTPYLLTDGGQNPINHNPEFVAEVRLLSFSYKNDNWSAFSKVHPQKVKEMLK